MKYKIHRLDRRYSYSSMFDYYIGFSDSMINGQGPLNFTRAQKWFHDTYGRSAEVKLYAKIKYWIKTQSFVAGSNSVANIDLIPECNQYWSWCSNTDDLRIYVATDKELAFFQLTHPLDR